MKKLLCGVLFAALSMASHASDESHLKLAREYVQAAQIEKSVNAETETYIRQYSEGATPEVKSRLEQYFKETIGWDQLKDQYIQIVAETFSTEELRASLKFMRSPTGKSMTEKAPAFSAKVAGVMALNMQKNQVLPKEPARQDARPSVAEVNIGEVEKFDTAGRVYFTGKLTNEGKESRSGLQVEINLFMKGKFVDQYSTYVAGTLYPGESRYFKISCGCKDNPPAEHDSYEVQVIAGY